MGDRKGGEGRPAGLPVINSTTALVQLFNDTFRELGFLRIQRVSGGLYSVEVGEHGAEEWETLYISTDE